MLSTVAAAMAAGCAIFFYWRTVRPSYVDGVPQRPALVTTALAMFGLAFCVWSATLERPSYSYARQSDPLAIAIAFDLSPSMLAIPDPVYDRPLPPRYARARTALLQFFGTLEERGINILVSSIGFTQDAEILTGWHNDPAQIRDLLEHGLSPGLFSSSGTSIEAAVETLVDVFAMLPQDLQEESRKIAILVSDGEDTTNRSYLGYTLEKLASGSFDIISLQTGSLGNSEGVPRYGEVGEFLGFERMSGRLHTVPDAKAMSAISRAAARRGLYVRAEDPAAADEMLQFLDHRHDDGTPGRKLTVTLLLFAVVALLCARVVQ